jgi:hypothetical protein
MLAVAGLSRFCRERLAAHKCSTQIRVMQEAKNREKTIRVALKEGASRPHQTNARGDCLRGH